MIAQGDRASRSNGQTSILIVSTVSATLSAFLLPYADHFRGRGWRVDAAANGARGDSAIESHFDSVHEISLSRSIRDWRGMLATLDEITRLVGSGYDIVHVHTPIAAFLTRAGARRVPTDRRPAIVYTAHGFHFHSQGERVTNAVFLLAERVAGRWTDRLIVINDEDTRAARRHRIVPRRHLVPMPGIGIDTDRFARAAVEPGLVAAVRDRLGLDAGVPTFVFVGEQNRNKRPVDVVEALAKTSHPEAQLIILGEGSEEQRVRDIAHQLSVSERVHQVGVVEDVRPYVLASTALVLASRREGLPRSIMEALSLEVPVITSAARGARDLVEPDAGIVVPIGDTGAMARAMDRVAGYPDLARVMGTAGRARMVGSFDVNVLVSLHEELYDDLLRERLASD